MQATTAPDTQTIVLMKNTVSETTEAAVAHPEEKLSEESLQALSLRDAVHLIAIYILVVGCILKTEA